MLLAVLPCCWPLEMAPPYLYFSYSFIMYLGASSRPLGPPLHLLLLLTLGGLGVSAAAGGGRSLNPRRSLTACWRRTFCVPVSVVVWTVGSSLLRNVTCPSVWDSCVTSSGNEGSTCTRRTQLSTRRHNCRETVQLSDPIAKPFFRNEKN